MAMSLSEPHPLNPHEETGVKLGDDQFAQAGDWESAGRLALVGMGVEPGLSDVFARYAVDHLFSADRRTRHPRRREPRRARRGGSRDLRAVLQYLDDDRGVPEPTGDLGAGARLVHHRAVQRTGDLRLPGGHRPGGVRQRGTRGGAAHAALAGRAAGHLQVRARRRVHRRAEDAAPARAGLDRTDPGAVGGRPGVGGAAGRGGGGAAGSGNDRPADDRARPAPGYGSPAPARTGRPREVYLYHVSDNAWTMAEYESPMRCLADRDEPGDRAGTAGDGRLVRCGRARPRGV